MCIVYIFPKSVSKFYIKCHRKIITIFFKYRVGTYMKFLYKGLPPSSGYRLPPPESRIISPLSTPAGIAIAISSSFRATPKPLQSLHFSRHLTCAITPSHPRTLQIVPKIERFVSCTFPLPLQFLHISISVPSLAPLPLQSEHCETLSEALFARAKYRVTKRHFKVN